MSVMDLAATAQTSGSGYIVLESLPAFPEYVDSDNYSRALARRTSDGTIVVVYARGSVHGLIETHNERSRISHERQSALKLAGDETLSDDERATWTALAETLAGELSSLPRTRAQATVHVARALTHYERAATDESATQSGSDESDSDSDSGDE